MIGVDIVAPSIQTDKSFEFNPDSGVHGFNVVYGLLKTRVPPEINAISTILLIGSMLVILGFALLARPGAADERR